MPKGHDSLAFRMRDGPVLSLQIFADTGQLSSWKESQETAKHHSCISCLYLNGNGNDRIHTIMIFLSVEIRIFQPIIAYFHRQAKVEFTVLLGVTSNYEYYHGLPAEHSYETTYVELQELVHYSYDCISNGCKVR